MSDFMPDEPTVLPADATSSASASRGVQITDFSFKFESANHQEMADANAAQSPCAATGGFAYTVQDVNLSAQPGSVTLICGGSGSGKSTLLKAISGLVPQFEKGIYAGHISVDGVDPALVPISAMSQHVASVMQNPRTQFFTTRVGDELCFAGQNLGWPAEKILSLAQNSLENMEVQDLADRSLATLSGGQAQRVACACALAQDAPVYLFDEPTGNLDQETIIAVRSAIRTLKEQGKTIFVAEHRLYYLRGIVDRVLLMQDGRVQRVFSGEEFYALSDEQRRELGLRTLYQPRFNMVNGCCNNRGGRVTYSGQNQLVARHVPCDQSSVGSQNETPDTDHGSQSLPHPAPIKEPTGVEAGLRIVKLKVQLDARQVLDLEELNFPIGSVTALIGENGVGKTTLARTLVGLKRSQKGSEVLLNGHKFNPRQAYLVMQNPHRQLFAATVAREASAEHLAQLDLAGLESRHPLSLSGGQKQRLVIATALDLDREVFIFDEPTSGVDYRHLKQIAQMLRSLASKGKVVIVISHDWEFLNACADQAYRLFACNPQSAAED